MSQREWSKVLALTLAGLLGGCAGAQERVAASATAKELPLPATPGQARAELASLEQQIQRGRQGLGLPRRRPEPTEAMDEADQAAGAVTEAESDKAPAAAPTARPMADAPESVQSVRPLSSATDRSSADKQRCSDPCRLARAICRAAQRICTIADYLRENDARGKCLRAKDDCNEARDKAGKCEACR